LDTRDLLRVWETGSGCRPLERALVTLSAHQPEATWAELAGASVGQRNRGLLEFRWAVLGRRLGCVVECPGCASQLTLELDIGDLLASASAIDGSPSLQLHSGAYQVEYRRLTTDDLDAVAASAGQAEARQALIERCVVSAARRRGRLGTGQQRSGRLVRVPTEALPATVIEALGDALAEHDPLVEIRLQVTCADCGRAWRPTFDIGAFVWSELSALAQHALEDVHTLASAYGWHEADILTMSPLRRQAYLHRAGND
jgi:hypothetical protein